MGFQEVQSLDSDVTIALGGVNKKTGKANPKTVEGYYLGFRTVESKKSKDGVAKLHFFQTEDGNIGVWGKTDLDRKLGQVKPGTMTRATFTGMQSCPGKNDMYKYKIEQDKANTIECDGVPAETGSDDSDVGSYGSAGNDDSEDETGLDDEEPALDEVPPARPKAAARPAPTATTTRVSDLLKSRNKSA